MSDIQYIDGGKLFFVDNEKCFAVGSRDVYQSDIDKMLSYSNLRKVLFYFIKFNDVDFSVLNETNIYQFTVLHGNFSGKELVQVCNIPSVKVVQLLDTLVSTEELNSIKEKYNSIVFK